MRGDARKSAKTGDFRSADKATPQLVGASKDVSYTSQVPPGVVAPWAMQVEAALWAFPWPRGFGNRGFFLDQGDEAQVTVAAGALNVDGEGSAKQFAPRVLR